MQALKPYLSIARLDHWFKNAFCLPGVVLAYQFSDLSFQWQHLGWMLWGLITVGLVASANYTINEILDAPSDREHPVKCQRPIPSGQVNLKLAYLQYALLTLLSLAMALKLGEMFFVCIAFLWVMGVIYNVKPIRSKDQPYFDTISESNLNNPIRMALGWYMITDSGIPTLSILLAYWMLGAFFMSLKRYAEYRFIDDPVRAGDYRRSFRFTNAQRLLIASVLYSNGFCIMYGVFITKFKLELIFTLPFVGLFIAWYLKVGLRENSPVQHPEKLYKEKSLMAIALFTLLLGIFLLYLDLNFLYDWFQVHQISE